MVATKKIAFLFIFFVPLLSQAADGNEIPDSLSVYEKNKEIPEEFKQPILTALSYFPELKEMHIIFRIARAYTPLTTRPGFTSMFKGRDHRTYIITISNETIDTLTKLLFKNLSFEQQVGVMGHELSHVADFNSKSISASIWMGIAHLSARYIDKMEFNTDLICIRHGLGKYLKAHHAYVMQTMHVQRWRGVDFVFKDAQKYERYMSPVTIDKYMVEFEAGK